MKALLLMNLRKNQNATNRLIIGLLLMLLVTWIFPPSTASAAKSERADFEDVAVFYQFGIQATFQARVDSTSVISEIILLVQSANQTPTSHSLTPPKNNEVIFQLNLQENSLVPFHPVAYWFKGRLSDGSTFESDHYSFDYIDNRFDWQTTTDKRFEIFWNSSDLALGDMVLTVALEGLRSAVSYLPVSPPLPIRIFIYSSGKDLQDALQLGRLNWIAGHTSADLNLILVSLPPAIEQRLELERLLPHELMHILIYQITGVQTSNTPAWLSEGLASLAEIYPNPDYSRSLDQAAQTGSLLPMAGLCKDFPTEASLALQAYAQSASFVRFLSDQYGIASLQTLLQKYTDGMDCESAVSVVYGSDLSKLESRWKQEVLGINVNALAMQELLPYLFIAAIILIPPLIVISVYSHKKTIIKIVDTAENQ
jgi:hypothetical protein